MGERLLCKQEVIGSIPFTSTNRRTRVRPRQAQRCCAVKRWGLIRCSEKQESFVSGV